MRWVLALPVAACSFSGNAQIDAGSGSDSGDAAPVIVDAARQLDAPPGTICFGSSWWQVCPITMPTIGGAVTMSGGAFDTDSAACVPLTGPNANTVCALFFSSLKLTATPTHVKGSKPLVLVALTTIINVTGPAGLDASSTHLGARGAGSDDASCAAGVVPTIAGGAGYGGSFAGQGGNGASSDSSDGGIAAAAVTTLTTIRGGCPGSSGIPNTSANLGHGGGAIVLIAKTEVKVDGFVRAAGSGGLGGNGANGGGGGGGSGGLIVIDAPVFSGGANGVVLATGGGGAEGSGDDGGGQQAGSAGGDPTTAVAASGGSLTTSAGGDGGDGNSSPALGGMHGFPGIAISVGPVGGGGGGGGGAGAIVVTATNRTYMGTTAPIAQ